MPTVAIVDGVRIIFYANEHPPPHFHAVFAEYIAIIDIDKLELVRGELPRTKLRSVIAWAKPRQKALLATWQLAISKLPPGRIE